MAHVNLLPLSYSLLDTKPEFVNTLNEVQQNPRAKYEVDIMDLKRNNIGQLTSEVERPQSHLQVNNFQKAPFVHHAFYQKK